MSFPIIVGGQFHGSDFELQLKYKYYGQKKSSVVKQFPKGGHPMVSFESANDKHFIQFHHNSLFYEINVTHMHGSIFSLQYNSNYIVYLAEVKKPDVPFYTAELGEKYKNKRYPILVVVDINLVVQNYELHYKLKGKPDELPGIKTFDFFSLGYIPWHFSLSPTHILFTGIYCDPLLLGVVYCPNRPSDIFQIPYSLASSKLDKLTDSTLSVRSPIYCESNDTIYYLANPQMGAHFTNCQIMAWRKHTSSIVVDVFHTNDKHYSSPSLAYTSDQVLYAGIYLDSFHIQAIYKQYLILDTVAQSRQIIVILNTDTGKITTINDSIKSYAYYGHNGTVAVIQESSIQHGIVVKSVDLQSFILENNKMVDVDVYYKQPGYGHLEIKPVSPSMDILIATPPATINKKKIIYYPHGGPHSAYTTAYSNNLELFLKHGFTIVLINYTGSIGYGINNVNELLGKVGELDIEECYKVVTFLQNKAFESYTPYVTGGSHGGFIAAWLVGKYPTLFKACVMRNPVINLGLNSSSDIQDWAFNEMKLQWKQQQPRLPTPTEYEIMYKHSSDSLCKHVTTPTLVMIGKDDLRVPPFQGLRWVQMVNAHHQNVAKAIIYEENGHALDMFEADVYGHHVLIEWFNAHE